MFACLDDLGPLGEKLREDGYPVCVLNRQPGWDLACARRLREFVKSEQVDLIHAHQYTPFSYALMSGLFRSRPPVCLVHGEGQALNGLAEALERDFSVRARIPQIGESIELG